MLNVVAAIIEKEGRILICQRPSTKARGLLWEFPGGKVEPGETLQKALRRECLEELDCTVIPQELFFQTTHQYPELTIHLSFFCCTVSSGQPRALEHHDIRWVLPSEILAHPFCPADQQVAQMLACKK